MKKDKKCTSKACKKAKATSKAAGKTTASTKAAHATAQKAYTAYKKGAYKAAKDTYDSKYKLYSKAALAAKAKVAKNEVKPTAGKALALVNKIVLKEKNPLYAPVTLTKKATAAEIKAFDKVLLAEDAFWKKLIKEVKSHKKHKALVKGAKSFLKAGVTFNKVLKAQLKLIKAKKAKKGYKAMHSAILHYKYALMKSTVLLTKGMATYESKANKKILKAYTKVYKKSAAKLVKANQKVFESSNTGLIIGLTIGGIAVAAFAVWWFKFRKTDGDDK